MVHLVGIPVLAVASFVSGYLYGARGVKALQAEIEKFHQVLAEYKTKLNV